MIDWETRINLKLQKVFFPLICWRYIVVQFSGNITFWLFVLLQKFSSFQKLHLQISFQRYWFSYIVILLLSTPDVKWSWKTLSLCERTNFRSISVIHYKLYTLKEILSIKIMTLAAIFSLSLFWFLL